VVSSRALRTVLIVLTVLGVALASYLTYIHYAEIKPLCTAGNSCIKVQSSVYSKLAGIPVALMGLLGYVAILGALLAPESENSRLAAMSLTLVGFGFSMYLTYRELFSIHAVCEECATSAGILTVLTVLSVWRFLRGDDVPGVRSDSGETAGASERPSAAGEQTAPLGSAS
jgi:uncharacterized membrane protein